VAEYLGKVVTSIIFRVLHRYADQLLINEGCLKQTLCAMDPEILTAWHIMFDRRTKCKVIRTESR
jgi:hypothetical protein